MKIAINHYQQIVVIKVLLEVLYNGRGEWYSPYESIS
jgi:hypothetical protein